MYLLNLYKISIKQSRIASLHVTEIWTTDCTLFYNFQLWTHTYIKMLTAT